MDRIVHHAFGILCGSSFKGIILFTKHLKQLEMIVCLQEQKTTAPTMHLWRIASGLAPFLERIGTRSQDSINERLITEKVTRFPTNLHQLSK